MSSKVCPSFLACVVGLSLEHGEPFGRKEGIGKSCLCHRFTHPGFDNFIANHQSLFALHEFEGRVINNDHFLYWGSPVKDFPSTDPAKLVRLRVHIVEHTVCYQDITCQPFTIITKPDNPDQYVKRIIGPIESPGKLSYQTRDDIAFPDQCKVEVYPPGMTKIPRGFLLVIDVSQTGENFTKQIKRAEKALDYLTKHKRKNVIVAAKRDIHIERSLEQVYELKKKYRTHVVEASAEKNLNIQECFRVLGQKLFKGTIKNLSSQVQTYHEAAHISLAKKGSARRSFISFLKKRITDPDERLYRIESNQEYRECAHLVGKFDTDKMFAEHILEVYNDLVDTYAGVKENPDMRQEFLEEFVEQRSDLSLYAKYLKKWIISYMNELPSPDLSEPDPYDTPPTQTKLPDEPYHIFEPVKPKSPSQSDHTVDSGFNQDTTTLDSHTSHEEDTGGHDSGSYYSDSSGEEGPDYVNFDPKDPPSMFTLPLTQPSPTTGSSNFHKEPATNTETQHVESESSKKNLSPKNSHASLAVDLRDDLSDKPTGIVKPLGPPPAPKPKPSRGSPRSSTFSKPQVKSDESGGCSPPFSPTRNVELNKRKMSIKNRARELQKLISGEEKSDEDEKAPRKRSPPSVLPRNSSLPPTERRPSTESDESSSPPCTPGGTRRKPARVAPPPPKPKSSTTSPRLRNDRELVTFLPKDPMSHTTGSISVISTTPKSNEQQKSSEVTSGKRRLDRIREKVNERRNQEQKSISNSNGRSPQRVVPDSLFRERGQSSEAPATAPKPTIRSPTHLVPIEVLTPPDECPPLPPRSDDMDTDNSSSTDDHPPLPPRTSEMFDISDVTPPQGERATPNQVVREPLQNNLSSEKTKQSKSDQKMTKKHKDYSLTKILKKSKSSERDEVTTNQHKPPSPTFSPKRTVPQKREKVQAATVHAPVALPEGTNVRGPKFVKMKNRPLPAEPFVCEGDGEEIDEGGHDYEPFDMEYQDKLRKLVGRGASEDLDVPQTSRTGSNIRKSQSFNTADIKRSRFKHSNPALVGHLPGGVWPDYIDGYVNTELPPSTTSPPPQPSNNIQTRPLPLTPFQVQAQKLPPSVVDSLDYDYPEVRTIFRTLPKRGKKGHIPVPPRFSPRTPPNDSKSQAGDEAVSLPPRKAQTLGRKMSFDDEYIHMKSSSPYDDDHYINSEMIDSIRSQLSGQSATVTLPPRQSRGDGTPQAMPTATGLRRHSLDDMSIYMNLPTPVSTATLPPRKQRPAIPEPSENVPPTLTTSQTLQTSPKQLRSGSEEPREAPAVRPKPVRQRASTCVDTNAVESVLSLVAPAPPSKIDSLPRDMHAGFGLPQWNSTEESVLTTTQSFEEQHEIGDCPDYINVVSSSLPPSFHFTNDEIIPPPIPIRRESRRNPDPNQKIKLPPRNIARPKM